MQQCIGKVRVGTVVRWRRLYGTGLHGTEPHSLLSTSSGAVKEYAW
jgi:hypothetical protein